MLNNAPGSKEDATEEGVIGSEEDEAMTLQHPGQSY